MMKRIFTIAVLISTIAMAAGAQVTGAPSTGAELSEAERDGLLLMREEEKLARDVYLALADAWDIRVFSNIARSEQTHMDRMADLLAGYGIADPIAETAASGEFESPVLSELYEGLMERGLRSPQEALLVGRDIEVLDIRELENLMAATDEEEIQLVYGNLLRGSENHLAAFNRQLSRY